MGLTPDRTPGPAVEEELQLEDRTVDGDPIVQGAMRRLGDSIRYRFSSGVEALLHKKIHDPVRSLIHFIDNGPAEGFATGAYKEVLPTANPFPTSIIWYTDNGKAQKIVEKTITYTTAFPTTIQWKMYDTDGTTVLVTVTDTISYSGPFETDRTRTIV